MERRLVLFITLSMAIMLGHSMLMNYWYPPEEDKPGQEEIAADGEEAAGPDGKGDVEKGDVEKAPGDEPSVEEEVAAQTPSVGPGQADAPADASPDKEEPAEPPEAAIFPHKLVTLGSADAADPYRMLVTLTSRGAAVARIELNSPAYHDLEDRGGYLGHLILDDNMRLSDAGRGAGALVDAVGPGTAAAEAGLLVDDVIVAVGKEPVTDSETFFAALAAVTPETSSVALAVVRQGERTTLNMPLGVKVQVVGAGTPAAGKLEVGDLITQVDGQRIITWGDMQAVLAKKKPKRSVTLTAIRNGEITTPTITLRRRPLEVTRPEGDDRLSLLLTLREYDGTEIVEERPDDEELHTTAVGSELAGEDLWTSDWELVTSNVSEASFRRQLPQKGLEVIKTYRLVPVPEESQEERDFKAYHLEFDVEIRNTDQKVHTVAYQLDGPTGLPAEGAWYANKNSRRWFKTAGLRDMAVSFNPEDDLWLAECPSIVDGKYDPVVNRNVPITFAGIDAQYFAAMLIPQKEKADDVWLEYTHPLMLGATPDKGYERRANTSCRLIGASTQLAPGESLVDKFHVFAGPKKPIILEQYGLGDLLYYGWFGATAKIMTSILHVFYAVVGNYGVAILMLTVLVRSCMFPISRKQAQSAQKMQALQPELKKLKEKYKNNMEVFGKAQQELFRKHNCNPLSGCLVAFIQLPIFLGLYRALWVDIELRQAPLISDSVRWCSNLAAPDMLYDWGGFMPQSVVDGVGFLGLGPYFNILPILTIVLFIVQQKMLMPPAADEQQAMQQNIMKYMMIFMGFLFFKVPSGLCVYFIASSLWGVAERKLLPKPAPPTAVAETSTRADAKARAEAERQAAQRDREAAARKKKKGKK